MKFIGLLLLSLGVEVVQLVVMGGCAVRGIQRTVVAMSPNASPSDWFYAIGLLGLAGGLLNAHAESRQKFDRLTEKLLDE